MQTPVLEKSVEAYGQLPLGVVSRGSEQLDCPRSRVGVANCGRWRSVIPLGRPENKQPWVKTLSRAFQPNMGTLSPHPVDSEGGVFKCSFPFSLEFIRLFIIGVCHMASMPNKDVPDVDLLREISGDGVWEFGRLSPDLDETNRSAGPWYEVDLKARNITESRSEDVFQTILIDAAIDGLGERVRGVIKSNDQIPLTSHLSVGKCCHISGQLSLLFFASDFQTNLVLDTCPLPALDQLLDELDQPCVGSDPGENKANVSRTGMGDTSADQCSGDRTTLLQLFPGTHEFSVSPDAWECS
jgi:hypothetical protein